MKKTVKKILVIDDDTILVRILDKSLRADGYEVIGALKGELSSDKKRQSDRWYRQSVDRFRRGDRFRQDQCKFFAAVARCCVTAFDILLQAFCNKPQDIVAGLMTPSVVEFFEMIDVAK